MHYRARDMIERHRIGEKDLLLPGIVPKLSETPGETRWVGPRLGEHTDDVLREAGYAPEEIAALRRRCVVE